MKIAITGTRGIPNVYGGFEQFAEKMSRELANRGHEVWVYNPHKHPYRDSELGRVRIIRKKLPERSLGPGANYLYDFICLKDAGRRGADIILECGYASAAPFYSSPGRRRSILITHMDGMEWQREKWSPWVKRMMRNAEKRAVHRSDAIVCDHPQIARYFEEQYSAEPVYIGYGAEILTQPDSNVLQQFDLEPGEYYISVARLEPENNIRMIIEGHRASGSGLPLLVIGDFHRGYGRKIHSSYSAARDILFPGAIFDPTVLDNLRHYARGLFHGHSVGGTNPSLLESMAAGAFIIAHDNPYNRHILGNGASYFSSRKDIKDILNTNIEPGEREERIAGNLERIRDEYQWSRVSDSYEKLFAGLMEQKV